MLFTLLTVPLFAKYLKQKSEEALHLFMKRMTIVVLCFDPMYWFWEYRSFGHFNLSTTLPLYICSLFWIVLPFAVHAKSPIIRQLAKANISSVVLLGGILGLVFNTHLDAHPFLSFVPMRSLIYHYLMIAISVSFWVTGYYQPQAKDSKLCLIPLFLLLIPCVALSYIYGWDYAFTGGGIGTPLEALSRIMSRPAYLFILYGTGILVIQLFYKGMYHLFYALDMLFCTPLTML